jgi:hypothetical protein
MVKNIRTKKTLGVERYPTLCLFKNGRQVAEKGRSVAPTDCAGPGSGIRRRHQRLPGLRRELGSVGARRGHLRKAGPRHLSQRPYAS